MTTNAKGLPTLSVVIPTIRPLHRIRPALDAVLNDSAVIEVVLAVDGPGAATLGADLDALDAASPRLRVLRLPERVGSETARRIGAEAALGEVVWFLDDDVVPDVGGGAGHVKAHAETGADVVIGLFTTPGGPDAGVPARLYDESFLHVWAGFLGDPASIFLNFWAGNHSVRRSSLLPLEIVPPAFRHTNHSDRAFGLICKRAGLVAVARAGLRATHHYAPAIDDWRQDCRRQGAGRVEIHRSFHDTLGPDVADPWRVGLGRRGRLALRVARMSDAIAAGVADALAAMMRFTTRWGHHAAALELGRVLRSVEQLRGAEAATRRAAGGEASAQPIIAAVPGAQPVAADLTLLVVSRGPGSQLRRVLEIWRPHVAEIVVVADRSGDPHLLDSVADLADRTATVESAFPIERVLEICRPLCRRPFVFRGDDDEVPTTTLLAELRSLTLDSTLQQAGIPMRWLWPNAATWIDQYPWVANPQPKLVRNYAGLVRFPGRVHTTEHLDAPIRAVNLPVYHLRSLKPIADRRETAARYAAIGGRMPHFDGRSANSQYVPEDAGDLRLVAVPAWDMPLIASALAGAGNSKAEAVAMTSTRPDRRHVPEPIALDAMPGLIDEPRHVSVRVTAVHPPVISDARAVVEIVIANRSDAVLPGSGDEDPMMSLSTRWRPADESVNDVGESIVDGQRLGLGEPIPPGRAVLRVVALDVPVGPGRWRVTVDLVRESVAWFGDGDEFLIDIPRRLPASRENKRPSVELFETILIETRNTCNRQCWFCKFGQERQDPEVRQMDWETIHRILANLKDLDFRGRISWYNINEPLLDPRIFEILSVTRQQCPGAFLSLATNGDALNAEKYERLKASGLDALGVSVYDDSTLARVAGFRDERMVLMDMRDAGPGRLDNRGGNVRQDPKAFEAYQSKYHDRTCERPSKMMTVNPAGQVVLCCADVFSDVVMGSVHEHSLEEIWSNDRFAHYRQTLMESGRGSLALCADCSYTGTGVRPFFPLPEDAGDPRVGRLGTGPAATP